MNRMLFIAVKEPIVVAWRWLEKRCGDAGACVLTSQMPMISG